MLSLEELLLRRKFAAVHRLENRVEPLFIALLVGYLAAFYRVYAT